MLRGNRLEVFVGTIVSTYPETEQDMANEGEVQDTLPLLNWAKGLSVKVSVKETKFPIVRVRLDEELKTWLLKR